MKMIPSNNYFDQIRKLIEATRQQLTNNKMARKELHEKIRQKKETIRRLERVASATDLSGDDPYKVIRQQIKGLNQELLDVRHDLLAAELFRSIELTKFHRLHQELDNFHRPFNAQAKSRKSVMLG